MIYTACGLTRWSRVPASQATAEAKDREAKTAEAEALKDCTPSPSATPASKRPWHGRPTPTATPAAAATAEEHHTTGHAAALWSASDPQVEAEVGERVEGQLSPRKGVGSSSSEGPVAGAGGRVVVRTCVREAADYEVSSCGTGFATSLAMTSDDGGRWMFSAEGGGRGPCPGRAVKQIFLQHGCYRVALAAHNLTDAGAYKYVLCRGTCPKEWRE